MNGLSKPGASTTTGSKDTLKQSMETTHQARRYSKKVFGLTFTLSRTLFLSPGTRYSWDKISVETPGALYARWITWGASSCTKKSPPQT